MRAALLFLAMLFASAAAAQPTDETAATAAVTPVVPKLETAIPAFLSSWASHFNQVAESGDMDPASPVVVDLLEDLALITSAGSEIHQFRQWPQDDDLIGWLIPIAGGDHRLSRIPATIILANVVDNTNVCLVLEQLLKPDEITATGRYNLLQVVRQVSNYAFADVAIWIDGAMDRLAESLWKDENAKESLQALSETQQNLRQRKMGRTVALSDYATAKYDSCVARLVPLGLVN